MCVEVHDPEPGRHLGRPASVEKSCVFDIGADIDERRLALLGKLLEVVRRIRCALPVLVQVVDLIDDDELRAAPLDDICQAVEQFRGRHPWPCRPAEEVVELYEQRLRSAVRWCRHVDHWDHTPLATRVAADSALNLELLRKAGDGRRLPRVGDTVDDEAELAAALASVRHHPQSKLVPDRLDLRGERDATVRHEVETSKAVRSSLVFGERVKGFASHDLWLDELLAHEVGPALLRLPIGLLERTDTQINHRSALAFLLFGC